MMKVALRIPSGTLFQTPKTDFEHARVWTMYVLPPILAFFLYAISKMIARFRYRRFLLSIQMS